MWAESISGEVTEDIEHIGRASMVGFEKVKKASKQDCIGIWFFWIEIESKAINSVTSDFHDIIIF